ncbi:hypothetical protein A0J61_11298, partial [Choanephora cucurbitarum]
GDSYCKQLRQASLPLGFSDESGILLFGSRPVLPECLQNEVFNLLHDHPTSGHLGIGRTLQRFSRLYYLPNMKEWITDKVNQCETCQRIKRTNYSFGHTKLVHAGAASHPFDVLAIDTFGPLPPSRSGNRYVIVVQCAFSRYVSLFAVPENNDQHLVRCLSHIIGEHGLFRVLLSDNGAPYSGTLIRSLAKYLGIEQRFAPAYHASSNGLVERFMETLKNMMSSYLQVNQKQDTWDVHLPEFQLAYNSSPHQTTKYTPFSLVHGHEARLLASHNIDTVQLPLGEYVFQQREFLTQAHKVILAENRRSQAHNAVQFNKHRKPPTFVANDLVLVDCPVLSNAARGRSQKLIPRFRGPFRITDVLSTDRYNVVHISSHKPMNNVHASRLKRYLCNGDIASANPPDVTSDPSIGD